MTTGTAQLYEPAAGFTDLDVAELQQAFGVDINLWRRTSDGTFVSAGGETVTSEILHVCEQALYTGEPVAQELCEGGCLLAARVPDKDGSAWFATAVVDTDSTELVVQLAKEVKRARKRQDEIDQLQAESSAYLQQLNEDLEELAFLRSMAERLALGGLSLRSENLVRYVLPQLGEAASVEELHFVDARLGHKPRVAESWTAADCKRQVDATVVERLVMQYRETTVDRPTVRNYFQESSDGRLFPGIHEFALVSVSTTMATLGWLVAINRRLPGQQGHQHPVWKLSHNELGSCEASLISTTAAMLASHAHNVALFEEREGLLISVVRTLVSAIESRDPYTCGHSERVARFSKRLAREVDFEDDACERIYLTGLLHDIGKIGLSDLVLKKTGPLTGKEFAEIKRHPDLGWAILRELESMQYVLPGVLHHHERYDGKGYPDGLMGDDTPLEGRLLAVADAFDAMTSDRPYRLGMPLEKAISILKEGAGTQWDAKIVDAFLRILPDILKIRDSYQRPPLPVRKPQHLQKAPQTAAAKAGEAISSDLEYVQSLLEIESWPY
jgi:HD-GYP domain-containing protein (c-di-GMP phosphodiesterase class II)